MAAIVAEAFLAAVFEKLFEQLASPELRKNSVASKLKQFEGKLKKARLLIDDAEDRQLTEPSVKEWLDELKHLVFMADDLTEEIRNKARSKREGNKISKMSITSVIKSVYRSLSKSTVRGEIDLILADLDLLLDRALVLDLKHAINAASLNRRTSQRLIAPLREQHHVFGREADKEEILKMLFSDDVWGGGNKVGVLPIVGMGGLGKTTLAHIVYDDARVEERGFSIKAWVTVSAEFDFCRVVRELLVKVNPETLSSGAEDPNELQRALREALRGKRFLFVLDDVWDESYDNWDLLMSVFATGDRRSRVIVTTRSREVGSIAKTGPVHELKRVSEEDCWSIFVHHALDGDSCVDSRFREIGRRIVEKCKGLPLAVKSIGGLLRSETNPEKWENVMKSRVWEWSKNQGDGVLPSLWLSYRYLPSSLKQCFAYCSVFPRGYKFRKEEMVLLWMAQGFLPSEEKEEDVEEVGERYFDDLTSRSLFQRTCRDDSRFKMHDLVHDLATFVSGEFSFRFENESTNLIRHLTTKTRHLSHNVSADIDLWTTSLSKPKHLHTFLALARCVYLSHELVKKLAAKQSRLRVLSLREITVPRGFFANLRNIRFLDLSGSSISEVPGSICGLYHLQTLLLSNCRYLIQLPREFGKLVNLRHLDTTNSPIRKMPPRMGNLKELRTLTDYAASGFGIRELGELRHLAGRLRVSGLQSVESAEDARKADLRAKSNVRELVLEWDGDATETIADQRDILEALRPDTNLEKLVISSYPGSGFPTWVGEISFSKLVTLRLSGDYDFCRSLPPLGNLPSLRELGIRNFNGVEKIGSEFYASVTPFRCLETLELHSMQRLKEWSFGCFPRLKSLEVIDCPNLSGSLLFDCGTLEALLVSNSYNSIEFFPLERFPNLKALTLNRCANLKSLASSTDHDSLVPSLTSIEIRNCPELTDSFPRGFPSSLSSLKVHECSKFVARNGHWDLQKLPSLTSLSVSDRLGRLDSFLDGMLPASLTSFAIQTFRNLKSLNGSSFQKLESLERLSVRNCDELEILPEKVLSIASLLCLEIIACPFLEKRYRQSRGRDWHNVSHIPNLFIFGTTTIQLWGEE